MAQPLDIRRTIEANRAELERYGVIFAHRAKNKMRGRPATAYYLNEPQTLLLCMFSRTEAAADVRQEVITVYMAYRRGQSQTVVPCAGCAFGEAIANLRTPIGEVMEEHLSPDLRADLFTPPNDTERHLLIDRRKKHRALVEQITHEIASRLLGQDSCERPRPGALWHS